MVYFITGNEHKFLEAQEIVPELERLDIDLPEIQDIDSHAIIKAKLLEGLRHHSGPLVVEDTSLYFDCLGGLPGPLIKWFLKTIGPMGLFQIVSKMGNSQAEARTLVGYAESGDKVLFFEGAIAGTIVEPRGTTTFGWDVIFQPEGSNQTFSEMSREEKNTISMRKKAFEQLKTFLALQSSGR